MRRATRVLEVRRHAHTEKGARRGLGSELSQTGVSAARRVGETTGPFEYVLVSDIPRTSETAVAMGFAVDDCVPMGGSDFEAATQELGRHEWWQIPQPFSVWKELIVGGGSVAALALHQDLLWRAVIRRVSDGSSALAISHGGLIEPGLVACVPHGTHEDWGAPFGNLEGARLHFEGDNWAGIELLRIGSPD